MTTAWIVVAVLFVGTAAMRAAGPVAFGGRSLSGRGASVVAPGRARAPRRARRLRDGQRGRAGIELDARLSGLAAAAVALALRVPLIAVVLVAALATALTRLI